jgi:hypothetical protein
MGSSGRRYRNNVAPEKDAAMSWRMNAGNINGRAAGTVLVLLALLFPAHRGLAGGPTGEVQWTGGYVRGVGQGTATPSGNRGKDRMMALRAAEVTAQRALAETIHGVRIDGETTVGGAMKASVVTTRVQGIVRGAQKVREDVTWDGEIPWAAVELRVCLFPESPECRSGNALIQALSVEDRKQPSYVPAANYEGGDAPGDPAAKPPAVTTPPPVVSYDRSRKVTALVLRAANLRFERELFPVIVTGLEKGTFQTVYSAKSVKPEVVRTYGVARYADSVEQALRDPRLGDNPMVVDISEVTRDNLLVLHPECAKVLRESTRFGNDYLGEAKVVIAGK